ncbi:MAG: hypothetical protein RLZZ511_2703 [Cyanobacteriota bacterium]|jgi:hypothetical protein
MTQTIGSQSAHFDAEFAPQGQAAKPPSEQYANTLMDEIFGDVEQVLDGSLLPPDEPVPMAVKHPDMSFDIAQALAERYPLLAQKLEEANSEAAAPELPGPDTALHRVDEKPVVQVKPTSSLSLFERLMIFTGCASAVAALAVWMISQGLLSRGANFISQKFANPAPTMLANAPAANPINPADAQFSEYVLRSLAALDRDAAANPQLIATAPSPAASGTTLPKPTANGTLPAGSLKLTPIQAGKNGAQPTTISATSPVMQPAVPQGNFVTKKDLDQVTDRIMTMLARVAPGVSKQIQAPAAVTPVKPRVAAAVNPAQLAPKVAPQYVVNGVVQMSDASKSVVTFNGGAVRVYVGETLANTGWRLIDVKGTKAEFRKNGEVRTISDGDGL